ncbi:hypothetical protein SPRG_00766 [Saprolegnia parasitica CBS 223.65]|uniref:Uncharacterized protein n=1 Tax=Saprolegnia parasitica (strain CBS 223.65) TaxID=695850 RepID=A0A067CW57_SAPPC|nr:hypothetical protein SPRG_00766 [Saprolegnia parasitica CBS 223.65]KDO34703.1 hypothetical protein SPRG_00766 [Saprolegnia parasitica CBS 223.65]|eukprot:XP_012194373.1 hypothetical protein SPRG_00766 [Saprolegnia parasitica CBS 223.65]
MVDGAESAGRAKLRAKIAKDGPSEAAIAVARVFLESLRRDSFPPHGYDRVFGVELMEHASTRLVMLPMGHLVFQVWRGLSQANAISEAAVVSALWQGRLPNFFRECVMAQADGAASPCIAELLHRGFSDIAWDLALHQLLAKLAGKEIAGLRVSGTTVTPEDIHLDDSFQPVPIAHAAAIPLYVKKTSTRARQSDAQLFSRLMADPCSTEAPTEWVGGGSGPAAFEVLVVRSDGIPFTEADWAVLDSFKDAMLQQRPRVVMRSHFTTFAKALSAPVATIALEVVFPRGQAVRAYGLEKHPELNGAKGKTNGKYSKGRVGVKFEGRATAVALLPTHLTLLK